jgi:hypothetical protein
LPLGALSGGKTTLENGIFLLDIRYNKLELKKALLIVIVVVR